MLIIKFIGNTETLIRHSNTVLVSMKGEDIGILLIRYFGDFYRILIDSLS